MRTRILRRVLPLVLLLVILPINPGAAQDDELSAINDWLDQAETALDDGHVFVARAAIGAAVNRISDDLIASCPDLDAAKTLLTEARDAQSVDSVRQPLAEARVLIDGCAAGDGADIDNPLLPPDEREAERPSARPQTFSVLAAAETAFLAPLLDQFASENNIDLQIDYASANEIRLQLSAAGAASDYDAVWPASTVWLSLGDRQGIVRHAQPIMRAPVVLGVKRSVAEELGWIDADVTVSEILAAAESRDLRVLMPSASQTTAGALAYLGFMHALGGDEVLTAATLDDPMVAENIQRLLATVDRSAASAGWLTEIFMADYADYDLMINYEAEVIALNQELANLGMEPLYAVYPVDGLAVADAPLAYVDSGNPAQEAIFLDLQAYLLSDSIQQQLPTRGWRPGAGVALDSSAADPAVFNPDWGITATRILTPIRLPTGAVVLDALTRYQTTFRKPSLTVYCLDFSGSMMQGGEAQLNAAMNLLLDPGQAARYLLQASPRDITLVVPFSHEVIATWPPVIGNEPVALLELFERIAALTPDGGTNIYAPVALAFDFIAGQAPDGYLISIVVMTDGVSNEGSIAMIEQAIADTGLEGVPVYAITFGDASEDQLAAITALTSGRIYDGTQDLASAFRQARANN